MYLEIAYAMSQDGGCLADSGLYVRCDDIRLIEFLHAGATPRTARAWHDHHQEGTDG